MILYDAGRVHAGLIFHVKGSVFPRSVAWAMPNALVSACLCVFLKYTGLKDPNQTSPGISLVWTVFHFALAFLSVFRTQQAYSRFTDGAEGLQRIRGHWFNVASCLIAFSTKKKEMKADVFRFQHLMVRLMSMLHCSALRQVASYDADDLEILDTSGLDPEALDYLEGQEEKCEIMLQWVQRAIVNAVDSGVIGVAPPILSRVFQELANGQISLDSARKLNEVPFPFPYAQMLMVMLLVQWVLSPVVCGLLMNSPFTAALFSFITVCSFWSINFIASEIEMPFGADPNDLPIAKMQREMNVSLLSLLEEKTQVPPSFTQHEPLGGRVKLVSASTRSLDLKLPVGTSSAKSIPESVPEPMPVSYVDPVSAAVVQSHPPSTPTSELAGQPVPDEPRFAALQKAAGADAHVGVTGADGPAVALCLPRWQLLPTPLPQVIVVTGGGANGPGIRASKSSGSCPPGVAFVDGNVLEQQLQLAQLYAQVERRLSRLEAGSGAPGRPGMHAGDVEVEDDLRPSGGLQALPRKQQPTDVAV